MTDPISLNHVFRVYRVHPQDDGDVTRVPAAKFFLSNDGMHVLEDHFGVLKGIEALPPGEAARRLMSLARHSMYWEVRCVGDIARGHHPELIQPVPPEDPQNSGNNDPKAPSRFMVTGGGRDPSTLEWKDGKAFLNGSEIGDNELGSLMEEVNRGDSWLAHDQEEDVGDSPAGGEMWAGINKAEGLPGLDHLQEALALLKQHVAEGKVHPRVYDTIRQEVFKDALTPALGNYRAHQDFLTRPRGGVHVHLDANDFGDINKVHGHHVGNEAIKALAGGITSAIANSVGEKNAKAFRVGGDEFRVHVPTHEHAAHFMGKLREHLEKIPPVGGTHHLSFSAGFGHTPEHAEAALLDAKGQKKAGAHRPGHAPTYTASKVPGT